MYLYKIYPCVICEDIVQKYTPNISDGHGAYLWPCRNLSPVDSLHEISVFGASQLGIVPD